MSTITIIATQGLRVPMADNPRRYITDSVPVTVENTAYYRRRVADGDVQVVTDTSDFLGITEHVNLTDSHAQE
ncbi:MAG: DUF2635 domain-containing protein [Desulfovibrionaceae bacterium]